MNSAPPMANCFAAGLDATAPAAAITNAMTANKPTKPRSALIVLAGLDTSVNAARLSIIADIPPANAAIVSQLTLLRLFATYPNATIAPIKPTADRMLAIPDFIPMPDALLETVERATKSAPAPSTPLAKSSQSMPPSTFTAATNAPKAIAMPMNPVSLNDDVLLFILPILLTNKDNTISTPASAAPPFSNVPTSM